MSVIEARSTAEAALRQMAGSGEVRRLFVPGRIEILGKHTDYAGGHSLTCAAERGLSVAWRPRTDNRLRIHDARDGRHADIRLTASLEPTIGHWTNYPMTVARRLARNFGSLARGADMTFCNTLPRAAGLSTSSALVIAVYRVVAEANALPARVRFQSAIPDDLHLAGYLGAIENGGRFGDLEGDSGVGTSGGSEDHTAILLSVPGHLGCYRYHPVLRDRLIPLPSTLVFVIAASGIAAAKTGAARGRYNRAVDLAAEIVRLAQPEARVGTLGALLESGALSPLRARLEQVEARFPSADLLRRLEHFVVEDRQILSSAIDALAGGRLEAFGAAVDRSQYAAEALLGNQVPETITLARLARELGASAATSFGAGFGGSVWALVGADAAEAFAERWLREYATRHPAAAARASSFITRPGPGTLHACET